MKKHALSVSLCMAIVILAGSAALAADSIKLRVADSFPNGHFIAEKVTRPWIADILKRAGNNLEIQYYPAEQLGKSKDLLSLASSGVVDIAYVAPAFVTDKLPLSVVAELPLNFKSSCQATPAYNKLVTGGGILAKQEFEPNKVRVLFSFVLPPYQMMTSSRASLDGLKSLKGLKIRMTGGAKERVVRDLGAVPIQIASPEFYEALSRGTIDGALWPYTSVYSYGVQGLFKHATVNENFGSFVVTYVMNERKWKSLPADIQKAISEASKENLIRACQVSDNEDVSSMKKLKASGWDIKELSAADEKVLREKMVAVSKEWADALDKRGKPGTKVLKAYEDALKESVGK